MPESYFGTYHGNVADALAEFRARFSTAVKRCFEPGSAILLSGGVDSAAVSVTACMDARAAPHLVHVHFPSLPQSDERQFASAVASAVQLPLHVVSGLTSSWDIGAELETHGIPYNWLPYGIDEPILAHLAANKIGVALDGHDGDGVLGAPGGAVWGSLILSGEMRRVAAYAWREGAKRTVRGMAADFAPPGFRPRRFRSPTYMELVAPYFREPLRTRILGDDIFRWRAPTERWRLRQLQPLLPRAVISFEQKEIEAARAGVDLRHPFADRELVEFLVSLPVAIKSDPGRAKPLLVDALSDILPESIHARRKSDYMASVRERVEPRWCVNKVRASKMRLPHIEYPRLFENGESCPEKLPLFFLVNLARVHDFSGRADEIQRRVVNGFGGAHAD
jgi:asparagine synthase (glutamine-hydrolysing)